MSKLKEIEYNDINFEVTSSQQFATVDFDRSEDEEQTLITTAKEGLVNQFKGDNRYNPSARRISTCVYVAEEWQNGKVIKICVVQHKGTTQIEIHDVDKAELDYLFGGEQQC